MRWNLGRSPSFFGTISDGLEFAAGFLSATELQAAQAAIDVAAQLPTAQRLAAAAASVQQARSIDSLNAKMTRWGLGKLLDSLDDEAARFDELYPLAAPHSVLLGPRFVKDNRVLPIAGVVASITGSKIFDLQELFGDPYWATVPASARLVGRHFKAQSGVDKGDIHTISVHSIASPAYIRLDGDPWADSSHAGVRFTIDGDGIPETETVVAKRARDWVISSAIQGTLTAVLGNVLTCANVFAASSYWIDPDGDIIPGNLAGRDLLIGSTAYRIVSHAPLSQQVTVEDATGIIGNEAFRIRAKSPGENGKQQHGTLREPSDGGRYSRLEPKTTVRLDPRMTSHASPALVGGIEDAMTVIARYTHARFAKWRGSAAVFRGAVRSHKLIVADALREEQRVADLRKMTLDMNLPLRFPNTDL